MRAFTAANAFVRIDTGIPVFHDNRIILTFALAASAANACFHAGFARDACHIAVAAANDDILRNGEQLDHAAGAGVDAGAAGGALVFIDLCNAVLDGDRTESAMVHTIAKANTGKTAILGAAGDIGSYYAALIPVVLVALLRNAVDALAKNACNLAFFQINGLSHDFCDSLCTRCAGRTAGIRLGFSFHHSLCKGFATCITAGTAVGAAQTFLNLIDAFIHIHMELFAGKGQNQTEKQS